MAAALLAVSATPAPAEPERSVPPDLIGTVETDKPVRPWELPPDTIPDVRPAKKKKKDGSREQKTAASVARAPAPDEASGVARGEPRTFSEKMKFVPRAVLF